MHFQENIQSLQLPNLIIIFLFTLIFPFSIFLLNPRFANLFVKLMLIHLLNVFFKQKD